MTGVGRFPRCWCRFLRCRPSSSPASPGSPDSEGVDGPAKVSPGRMRRHWVVPPHLPPRPSEGGRAGSPRSTNRARIRGLSIVLGSPPPSKSSSSSSGGRGPPCRSSRWSGCAAATDLPPASSCVPTPLAEAEPARLSPPPVVDPNPHLEPPALAGPRAGTSRAMAGRTSRLWLRVTICAQSRRLCQRAPTPRP